jgi:hypothetical protein
MRPSAFRELPKHEQIEMMAHRREYLLRKSHGDHVAKIIADQMSKEKPDQNTATRRRGR